MPVFEDWLNEPLAIIDNLFASNPSTLDERVQEYFNEKLKLEKNYEAIPSLNDSPIHELSNNSLVRFRCMIQDSSNPEYFASCQKLKHGVTQEIITLTTKYRDSISYPNGYDPLEVDQDHVTALNQRLSLYCVPIPGEQAWVREAYKLKSTRTRSASLSNEERTFKRSIDVVVEHMSEIDLVKDGESNSKRTRVDSSQAENKQDTSHMSRINLNMPLNEHGVPCCVRIYENFDHFKLNDICEFIGILTFDPHLTLNTESNKQKSSILDESDDSLHQDSSLPSSLVPRMHCVKASLLKHNNPLMIYPSCDDLIQIRHQLIEFLKDNVLFGDALAAEYLLMNMIAGVFTRKDVTVLGKFTLNLYNLHTNFAHTFYNCFKKLVTMCHKFNLTIDSLNKSNMIPNKDYNTDRLITGMLQLPAKFHMIIDETSLDAGELNQKGLLNVQALSDIIRWQKLNYDFSFHPQEFHTNLRVLTLSSGKSILPYDCQLKMNVPSDIQYDEYETSLEKMCTNEILNNLRRYFTLVADFDYKMSESMQKIVEEDFVKMRQTNDANLKMNADDFHLLLVIARLQSLSYGKIELQLSEWNRAKYLDKERRKR